MQTRIATIAGIGLSLSLSLACAPLHAEEMADAYIKYRQGAMKAAAGHFAAAKRLVAGSVTLPGHLERHAHALADLGVMIPKMFPADSDFGETDVKAAVWEQREEFLAAASKFEEATKAFAANPDGDRLGDIGQACKGCHDQFREK